MITRGEYIGACRTLEGDLTIQILIDENDSDLLEELEKIKGKNVAIDMSEIKEKRSDKANRYMWAICDQIAKAIGSTKDIVYIMNLQEYGIFDYMEIPAVTLTMIKDLKDSKGRMIYRQIDVVEEYSSYVPDVDGNEREIDMIGIRCFFGSHGYSKKQMADLIDGIVNQANELKIPTITAEELKRLAGCC